MEDSGKVLIYLRVKWSHSLSIVSVVAANLRSFEQ